MPSASPAGLQPEFVQRLTASQSAIYAHIVKLTGSVGEAADVLQETNVKLCEKAAEYDATRAFLPWAFTFARFEVMAWRKRQQRSRLVLDDELIELVAAENEAADDSAEGELRALEGCVEQLKPKQRELVEARYRQGETVRAMAERLGRPENALAATLYRVRKALGDCIEAALPQEGKA